MEELKWLEVIVGKQLKDKKKNYPANTTVRTILEDSAIDYSVSQIMMMELTYS